MGLRASGPCYIRINLSLLNVINSISRLAISVPEDDEEAMHVFWLAFPGCMFYCFNCSSVLSFGTTFVEI